MLASSSASLVFADPGRSGEEDQATVAGEGRRPPAGQLGQLSFPPSQLPGARGITSHITTIPARPNAVQRKSTWRTRY